MANQGLFSKIQQGFSDAISDIREKVVEEPMWGRSLSDSPDRATEWPKSDASERSFGSLETHKEFGREWPQAKEQTVAPTEQTVDRGMDR